MELPIVEFQDEKQLTFAVISDIHAYSKSALEPGERKPSWVEVSDPSDVPGLSPFAALKELIVKEKLRANTLICCGDIGDKASPEALRYAWDRIQEIKSLLHADELIVTSGNHDLDSRHKHNDNDARAALQSLGAYPFSDEALNNEYWAHNVVVLERPDYRIAILNSSAHHGFNDEHEHGRISMRTLQYLRDRLAATEKKPINILVCHHHVMKIGPIDLGDDSVMIAGTALVNVLESGEYGDWLVVHGHRHWPNVAYAGGAAGGPVVFSAGSLSAILYDELQDKARNQFYILNLPISGLTRSVRGTFLAWDWVSEDGFSAAQGRSGLPHWGGFGARKTGDDLAREIAGFVGERVLVPWPEVLSAVPDLEFTMPLDMQRCRVALKEDHGLEVLEADGEPRQIGRVA